MKKLIVMADYMAGLFLPEGSTDPDLLGLPPELCGRFEAWLKRYQEPDQAPHFDRATYNGEGRALAGEIQQLLADNYSVTYRYLLPLNHADDEWHWAEEVVTKTA